MITFINKSKDFISDVFKHFTSSNPMEEGAALGYYAVFSILPIVIIAISIFSIIWGEKTVTNELYNQLEGLLGHEASLKIHEVINNHHENHNGHITAIIGGLTLVFSSLGLFNQLQKAFNNIWNLKEHHKISIKEFLIEHIISFLMVITLFVIIMLSVFAHTFLVHHAHDFSDNFRIDVTLEHWFTFILLSLMFGATYKLLGKEAVHWKACLISGVVTAKLFSLGKYIVSYYIFHSSVSTEFGSASVVAILMVWTFGLAQVIFLGASFLCVLEHRLYKHDLRLNIDILKKD